MTYRSNWEIKAFKEAWNEIRKEAQKIVDMGYGDIPITAVRKGGKNHEERNTSN